MLKKTLLGLVFLACSVSGYAQDDIADAVVKIYAAHVAPDYANPWRQHPVRQSSASGAYIKVQGRNCIITNAHAVSRATFIQVKHSSGSKKYQAKPWFVAHDADLALLTIEEDSFFEGMKELNFGETPMAQSEVLLYGFPMGGTALSITKGILSRIDYQPYAHSKKALIVGQIDAAMNPGNSGGPVIVDNKIVGIAMQGVPKNRAESISYMIPIEVVQHFFTDIEDGVYNGVPEIGAEVQKIENPALKLSLGLGENKSGLLVTYVYPESSVAQSLKIGDVITKIAGREIGDDTKVAYRHQERISVGHFIDQAQVGEDIDFEISRNGKVLTESIKLEKTWKDFYLVKAVEHEKSPKYYIYGGLVFTVLSHDLLSTFRQQPPINFLYMVEERVSNKQQEVIVLQNILGNAANRGYDEMRFSFVEKVNGEEFKDFKEFVSILEENEEEYIKLHLDNDAIIVLSREEIEENHQEILSTYRIQHDRSEDLRD